MSQDRSKLNEVQRAAAEQLSDDVISAIKTAEEHGVHPDTIESVLRKTHAGYRLRQQIGDDNDPDASGASQTVEVGE